MVSTSLMARTQVAGTVGQSLPAAPPTSQTTLPPGEAGKPMETRKKAAPRAQGVPDGKKTDLSANAILPQSTAFKGRVSGGAGGGASAGASFGGPITGRTTSNRDFAFTTAPKIAPPVPTAKQNTIPLTTSESVVVPRNSEVVEVQSEAASIATQSAASPSQDQLLQNEPSGRVGKAKPALEQASSAPPAPVLRADSRLMKSAAAPPRWTISSNGALQRSFDGGRTWLDVNIAADNSMSFNFVNRSHPAMVTVEARSETKNVSGVEQK